METGCWPTLVGIVVTLSFIFTLTAAAAPDFIQQEERLYSDLMKDYNKWIRPVVNSTDTVTLMTGITLQAILDVNEDEGYLKTILWWNMAWNDVSLKWDPKDYFNIRNIRLPREMIWIPDLLIYNSIGEEYIQTHQEMAVVSYAGNVTFIPPRIAKTSCLFDYTYYPYDKQYCKIKIGSWHHDGGLINLTMTAPVDTSTFLTNAEWELTGTDMQRNAVKYECCPEVYIDLTATLTIQRRRGSYAASVLEIPGIILALMIPFVFMFPPDSGEKINLGVGVILGYLLLLVLGDGIHGGRFIAFTPMIFRYYIVNIVLAGLAMIIAMALVHLWRDRGRVNAPPKILTKVLVNGLGVVLCVKRSIYQAQPRTVSIDAGSCEETENIVKENPDVALEWRLLAVALDRFFFVIFLALSVFVSLVMLAMSA